MDASTSSAPFRGVPITVKDLAATAGIRTTYSSHAYARYVPDFDTSVVRRLRDAGFVFLGKSNTPEFGTTAFTESDLNGATRNPWNTELTPGGSSGGAAAGLAAGLTPIAHGTDGGGSIRIPASCCGVLGLKPSRGRVSAAPFTSLEGLSTAGPIARSVEDAAAPPGRPRGVRAGRPMVGAAAGDAVREGRSRASRTPASRRHDNPADRDPGRSRVRCGRSLGGEPPPGARPRRRRGHTRLARARPLPHLPRGLASRSCAPSDRRPVAHDHSQPRARRVGATELRSRLRTGRCPARRRSRGERSLSGASTTSSSHRRWPFLPSLSGGRTASRAPSSNSFAARRSPRSPRSRTSPASRRSRCRCTGASPACRSGFRRSGRRPETRSSSSWQRSSRSHGPGRTAGRLSPRLVSGRARCESPAPEPRAASAPRCHARSRVPCSCSCPRRGSRPRAVRRRRSAP